MLATTNAAASALGEELRSLGIDAVEIGGCAALRQGRRVGPGDLIPGAEKRRGKRQPVHIAQDQSRLRHEKPIDRQYRRAPIAPSPGNTKLSPTGAMMVYGLKATAPSITPYDGRGLHPYALHPVRMPTACQPAEGYLERSTSEPSAGDSWMAP